MGMDIYLRQALASNGTRPPSEAHGELGSALAGIFTNSPFLIAVLCFLAAQLSKLLVERVQSGGWQYERLVGSGGMPSSHSAFVTGLATAVGIREGTSSSYFSIALVLALVVMYDAVGLRLHSGRHAAALNLIITELPPDHPVQTAGSFAMLREQLGHTPLQVAMGSLLGFVLALIVQGAVGSSPGARWS